MIKNKIETIQPQSEKLDGIYRGVVEDNNDPLKSGLCKIRVFGVHTENKFKNELDGIPTDELPWAEPALGLFEGGVSGYGSWTAPLQGSHVFLFFEAGNILQPRYFASAPGIPTESPNGNLGFNDPAEQYPESDKLNEPDWSKDARGEESRNRNGEIEYGPEYPHNTVYSTHGDLIIEIDSTPNKERINIWHKKADSYIEMDTNGNMVINNSNDRFENTDNNQEITIVGNYNVSVEGTIYIEAKGETTVNGANVYLNDGTGKIVTTNHICQVTGLPHNNGSSTCYAEE